MSKPLAMQLLKRKPDTNGNIPRMLAVYDQYGNVHELITIDYGNIPMAYRDVVRLPDMLLTPGDFREWKNLMRNRENP